MSTDSSAPWTATGLILELERPREADQAWDRLIYLIRLPWLSPQEAIELHFIAEFLNPDQPWEFADTDILQYTFEHVSASHHSSHDVVEEVHRIAGAVWRNLVSLMDENAASFEQPDPPSASHAVYRPSGSIESFGAGLYTEAGVSGANGVVSHKILSIVTALATTVWNALERFDNLLQSKDSEAVQLAADELAFQWATLKGYIMAGAFSQDSTAMPRLFAGHLATWHNASAALGAGWELISENPAVFGSLGWVDFGPGGHHDPQSVPLETVTQIMQYRIGQQAAPTKPKLEANS